MSLEATAHKKLKGSDGFSHVNYIKSIYLNASTLKHTQKFDHPFYHLLLFSNILLKVTIPSL